MVDWKHESAFKGLDGEGNLEFVILKHEMKQISEITDAV
jgi:hypothetical protein